MQLSGLRLCGESQKGTQKDPRKNCKTDAAAAAGQAILVWPPPPPAIHSVPFHDVTFTTRILRGAWPARTLGTGNYYGFGHKFKRNSIIFRNLRVT